MSKATVSKLWIGGLVVFAAGLLAAAIGVFLMLAYAGTFTQVAGNPNSYDFVPRQDPFFWTTVAVITAGGLIAAVGGIVQLAAWVGALVNSYWLPEKTWFSIVLIGGIASLAFGLVGFAVMIAYVIAAPDGLPYRDLPAPSLARPAPTS